MLRQRVLGARLPWWQLVKACFFFLPSCRKCDLINSQVLPILSGTGSSALWSLLMSLRSPCLITSLCLTCVSLAPPPSLQSSHSPCWVCAVCMFTGFLGWLPCLSALVWFCDFALVLFLVEKVKTDVFTCIQPQQNQSEMLLVWRQHPWTTCDCHKDCLCRCSW